MCRSARLLLLLCTVWLRRWLSTLSRRFTTQKKAPRKRRLYPLRIVGNRLPWIPQRVPLPSEPERGGLFFFFSPPFSWRFFGRATAGGATRSPKHAEPTPPLAVVLREENKLSEAEKNQAGVIIDRVQYALRASKVTSAASCCSVGTLPPPPLPPPPPAQLRRRPTAGGLPRPTLGKKSRGLMRSELALVA